MFTSTAHASKTILIRLDLVDAPPAAVYLLDTAGSRRDLFVSMLSCVIVWADREQQQSVTWQPRDSSRGGVRIRAGGQCAVGTARGQRARGEAGRGGPGCASDALRSTLTRDSSH